MNMVYNNKIVNKKLLLLEYKDKSLRLMVNI